MRGTALIVAALLGAASHAGAQEPPPVRPPPIVTDTSDMTARFLEAGELERTLLTPVPRPGAGGLLPVGGRIVFHRDSIEWGSAATLGELLQQVPGVYLARGFWIGTPEVLFFRGQAGSGIEYLLDGVPYLPVGDDSTAVDPSLLPVSFYERVEVERHPAGLRIHLLTRRHDRAAPRTRIAVGTGDLEASRYQGSLEKRFPSGVGFSGAFDFFSVAGLRNSRINDYQNTNAWVQGSWVRSERSGLVLQYFLSNPIRRASFGPASNTTDTLARPLEESRRDLQVRGYLRQRRDGLGGSLDLVFSRTTWAFKDSIVARDSLAPTDGSLNQVGVIAGYRTPMASSSVQAFRRSDWTTLDLLGRVGFAPDERLALAAEAGYRTHAGDRTSDWILASASLELPLGLRATGSWKVGSVVDLPMLASDTAREVDDRSVMVGWDGRRWGAEAGYARTSAATPAPSWVFPAIGTVGRIGTAEWITGHLRLTPSNWFTLDGWHSAARGGAQVEGQPPTHSMVTAAIRSKFLRVYPSGFLELKAAATVETFGTGTLGRTADGDPVTLPGATFARVQFQIHFGDLTAYWDRQNFLSSDLARVPGIPSLPAANVFGIRWVFWN